MIFTRTKKTRTSSNIKFNSILLFEETLICYLPYKSLNNLNPFHYVRL